jgi:hypothetical protein
MTATARSTPSIEPTTRNRDTTFVGPFDEGDLQDPRARPGARSARPPAVAQSFPSSRGLFVAAFCEGGPQTSIDLPGWLTGSVDRDMEVS